MRIAIAVIVSALAAISFLGGLMGIIVEDFLDGLYLAAGIVLGISALAGVFYLVGMLWTWAV